MKELGGKGSAMLLAGAAAAVLAVGAGVRALRDPGASAAVVTRSSPQAPREASVAQVLPEDLQFLEPRADPQAAVQPGAVAVEDPARSPLEIWNPPVEELELPPAPRPLPAGLPGPYGSKYAGHYPDQLEAAQRELQHQQSALAQPLLTERLRLGQYRVVGPVKDGRFPGFDRIDRDPERRVVARALDGGKILGFDGFDRDPRATRPLVSFVVDRLGDGFQQFRVVEVHPYELPDLQALRDEEVWLQTRIDELEAEWEAWAERAR